MGKFNRFSILRAACAAGVFFAANSTAWAVMSFGNVTPTKSNGTFIPGTGIPGCRREELIFE